MTPQLQRSIVRVYEAFSNVPRPSSIDGCPCCIDKKGISILLSKPLQDLSPDDLTHYAASVFLTVGSIDDFLYYLPRILEILATAPGWWPDPEVVTRAIDTAEFSAWPQSRRRALHDYFGAVIDELLAIDDSGFDLDSWICALGRLHIDLDPFLDKIADNCPRLIEYYEINSCQLTDSRMSNSFWDEAPKEMKQVVDWFKSDRIHNLIFSHYGLA